MDLAFCLYRYTPFGGLERNCLALAEACVARGHRVTVFTRAWEGERPAEIELCTLPVRALTNIGLDTAFVRALERRLMLRRFDAVVGFNLLPCLDVFYAADPCFAAGNDARGALVRAGRRFRTRVAWEHALCSPLSTTELLVLSARERESYGAHHGTPPARLHVLPPGLRAEFLAPEAELDAHQGAQLRAELGIPAQALLVLAVGSDFERKGLARTLHALARLPAELRARTWLLVVGAGRPRRHLKLARTLDLAARVRFAGGRTDVRAAYQAADLLVHPAHEENTGTVLLEALSQGVPVIASGLCGFAEHVRTAGAGSVLPEPFVQADLERELGALLADAELRRALGARGRAAAQNWPMAARTELAVAVIERAAARKNARRLSALATR